MFVLKNRPVFIVMMALAVIGAITVITLDESISVSDGIEAENIPITTSELSSITPISSDERFSSQLETFGTSGPGIAHTYPDYNIEMPRYVTIGDAFDININYSFVETDTDDDIIDTAIPDNGPNVYLDGIHSGVKLITFFPEEFELQNKDDIDFMSYSVGRDSAWDRYTTFSTVGLFYNLEGPKTVTYSFILNNTVSYPNNEFQMALDVYNDYYYLNQVSEDTYEISKTLVIPNFGPEGEPQPPYPGRITSSFPPISIGNDFNSTSTQSVDTIESLILFAENDEMDEILDDFGFETIEEFYYSIFSSELVDEFLEKYPQYSNANFILPTFNWILPEAYGQSFQQFIAQGQVLIENDSGDFVVPEGDFYVCAYDENLLLPDDDPIPLSEYDSNDHACDDLNSRGYFSMRVSPTDPNNDGTTPDIVIGLPLENGDVKMFDNLDMPKQIIIYTEPRENVSSILVNFVKDDIIEIDDEDFLKSYKVYGTVNETLETFSDLGFNTDTQLKVLYDPVTTTEFRFMYQSNTIKLTDYHHPTSGQFIRSIVDHPVAISHEVGHFIQDKTYKNVKGEDGRVPSCAGVTVAHGANVPTNPQCAWGEGWATFVGILTSNSSEYTTFVTNDDINYESGTSNRVTFPTSNGYSIEGWVTAALWDIHDTVDERSARTSHDRIDGQTQNLWDTFSTDSEPSGSYYIAENMREFKDDWNELGFTSIAPLFSLNHLTGPITTPPTTTSNTIFSDDFEGTLSKWTNTGDDSIWEILTISGDKVASSDDCSTYCYLESDTINASQATTLTFDRYIDTGVDKNEGLKVLVSTDNGASYTELAFYSQNYGQDDSIWHTETLDITQYQSSTFKVKFTGVSSYYNDIVRIDDVIITGSTTPTVTPPTTSQSFTKTQTLDHTLIDNSLTQENVGSINVNKDITIETIEVKITVTHTYHGDLIGELVSPSGESVKILNQEKGRYSGVYTYIVDLPTGKTMNNFVGDDARGIWKLTMGDYAGRDVGTVTSWTLSITGTNEGTITPTITPTITSTILFSDEFNSGVGDWEKYSKIAVHQGGLAPFDNYNLSRDSTIGKPFPSAHISGDGFASNSGIQKTVDISSVDGSPLYLSFDYRATSNYAASSVTNTRLNISDGVTGETLHSEGLIAGGTRDSGWQSYNTDISTMTSGHDSITIQLYLSDSWSTNWNQQNWYDNITLSTIQPEQTPQGQSFYDGYKQPQMTIPQNMTSSSIDKTSHFECENLSIYHDYTNDVSVNDSYNCSTAPFYSEDPESADSIILYEPKDISQYTINSEFQCVPVTLTDVDNTGVIFACDVSGHQYTVEFVDSGDDLKLPLTLYHTTPDKEGIDVYEFVP